MFLWPVSPIYRYAVYGVPGIGLVTRVLFTDWPAARIQYYKVYPVAVSSLGAPVFLMHRFAAGIQIIQRMQSKVSAYAPPHSFIDPPPAISVMKRMQSHT